MEIVTYSSVSENIYMDKKNNHDSLFIVSREPKLRFSADHRGYHERCNVFSYVLLVLHL